MTTPRYELVQPVKDNRTAFRGLYPDAYYIGDIGDAAHLEGGGDHTPWAADVIFGRRHKAGWVYAQDLGGGGDFNPALFTRWLLDHLRAGDYPEVKYVISRLSGNLGVAGGKYYGLFDRRYQWRTQRATGHTTHVHVSYMPGYERTPSRIIADYHRGDLPPIKPDPVFHRWAQAPPIPALPMGTYSTRTLNRLPRSAYPPMVLGYGGPESPQQQFMVAALQRYATVECKTVMIPRAEIDRAEFGPGSLEWFHMVTTRLGGNPWVNDPARNGRAFAATIGAPANW